MIRFGAPPCEQESAALLDCQDAERAQCEMDKRDELAYEHRRGLSAWNYHCYDLTQWLLVLGVFAVVVIFYVAASEARDLTSGIDTAKINQAMGHVTAAARNVEMATFNVLNVTQQGGDLATEAAPILKQALSASNSLVSQMYSFSTHPSIRITSGFGQT